LFAPRRLEKRIGKETRRERSECTREAFEEFPTKERIDTGLFLI
jgi:hypothetical protein